MYIFSLYTNCFGLFILVIGYGKYANTGYEETGAWLAGKNTVNKVVLEGLSD